jgi:hypothetical protein
LRRCCSYGVFTFALALGLQCARAAGESPPHPEGQEGCVLPSVRGAPIAVEGFSHAKLKQARTPPSAVITPRHHPSAQQQRSSIHVWGRGRQVRPSRGEGARKAGAASTAGLRGAGTSCAKQRACACLALTCALWPPHNQGGVLPVCGGIGAAGLQEGPHECRGARRCGAESPASGRCPAMPAADATTPRPSSRPRLSVPAAARPFPPSHTQTPAGARALGRRAAGARSPPAERRSPAVHPRGAAPPPHPSPCGCSTTGALHTSSATSTQSSSGARLCWRRR